MAERTERAAITHRNLKKSRPERSGPEILLAFQFQNLKSLGFEALKASFLDLFWRESGEMCRLKALNGQKGRTKLQVRAASWTKNGGLKGQSPKPG